MLNAARLRFKTTLQATILTSATSTRPVKACDAGSMTRNRVPNPIARITLEIGPARAMYMRSRRACFR